MARSSTGPPESGVGARLRRAYHMVRRAAAAVFGATRLSMVILWTYVRTRGVDAATVGRALRRYLESMGFTYVKMGQFLALRFDILPGEVCEELRKLFDRARPLPFAQVRTWIEAELGGPLDDHFRWVAPEAVAAASLAQVHEAITIDGQRVALKVQRPRTRTDFDADMRLAHAIARVVDWTGLLRSLSLEEMLGEFERFTERELDFRTEGRVATRLAGRAGPGVRVPSIRWDLTTTRLLTMEYIEGRSLIEAIELTKRGRRAELEAHFPGLDMNDVMRTVANESLRQILVDGLFHADPHPGNILVAPDGAVVYLDFGMFGVLSPSQRMNCTGYIENAAMGHADRSFEYFFRLVIPTPDLNRVEFKRDMVVLMRDWAEWSAGAGGAYTERHLGAIMTKTLATMRSNGTRLDTDLLLFWRVLFVLDSVALDLAEHVDLIEVMQEFFVDNAAPVRRRFERLADSGGATLALHRRSLARAAKCIRTTDEASARHVVTTRQTRTGRTQARDRIVAIVAALGLVTASLLVGR